MPQSLERCYNIDDTLAKLARTYPDTKFLRAKASSLGFASLNTSSKPKHFTRALKPLKEDDEEDPYSYSDKDGGDDYDDEEDEGHGEDDVDLDMLPTMLVYRNGELVYNWVRVDWEAGDEGLDEFLDKYVMSSYLARDLLRLRLDIIYCQDHLIKEIILACLVTMRISTSSGATKTISSMNCKRSGVGTFCLYLYAQLLFALRSRILSNIQPHQHGFE